jgi:hypothetical protein
MEHAKNLRRPGTSPAATAAAEPDEEPSGDSGRIMRIPRRPGERPVASCTQRELVQVGLSYEYGSGLI